MELNPADAGDTEQGPQDAPITLVEYGDYECPYCGMAYPIVKSVQRRLGDQLRFFFRHFPLTAMHPHAEPAAEMAEPLRSASIMIREVAKRVSSVCAVTR